ncbi:hypothetical protein CYFUS_001378 [Cystobacter fuscus]|uniref:PIN domain-containing protein n=2 Tax=Cystobacter fuscus TaxID=43 RepID=A0A250IW50_9BACT|nr:hypothetical protein CYFUS_001378 [Cystobacter fuscus]
MEMLLDIRQKLSKRGMRYDASVVDQGLQDKGLHVVAFEKRHSERSAERIAGKFPDIDAWREAKRLRYVKSLGLTDSEELKKRGKRYSATVDWLIAAQASQEEWILVTNDKGDEFAGMELIMSLNALEELLDELIEHRRTKGTL